MRLARPALAWALLAVLLVWLTTTAAQMAAVLPGERGGLFAGIGIGVGAAASGIGWLLKLIRPGGGNGEELHRVRRVEELLVAMVADLKAQTRVLEELARAVRPAIAAIHRMEEKA